MKEEAVYTAAKIIGFTPLELVLLMAIGTMAIAVWRFVIKHSKDSTAAINNNTNALKGIKDEMARKLTKATKTK